MPFENPNLIEKICEKNDTPLFWFGSNSKKKPNNITIGRCFNNQVNNFLYKLKKILDMCELGLTGLDDTLNMEGLPLHSRPVIFF